MFASLLEAEADNLRAVKSWAEYSGELPGGLSYWRQPEQWRIMKSAFVAWCKANGYPIEPARNGISETDGGASEPDLDIHTRRGQAILQAIQQRSWNPLSVPKGGVKAIKSECMQNAKLFTESIFDRAWKASVKAGRVRTANHDTYAKR